jgi:hypothetical protein
MGKEFEFEASNLKFEICDLEFEVNLPAIDDPQKTHHRQPVTT